MLINANQNKHFFPRPPQISKKNNNVQSFHTNNQLPVCYAENSALLEMSAIMPDLLKIFLAQEPIISTWLCRFYLKVTGKHIMCWWEYKKPTRLKSKSLLLVIFI